MERKKILLIEDEVKLARFVELELKYEGYDVTTCHDGRVGMEMITNQEFDMILLDLMLPGLTGIEICRRVRKFSQVPIIMLTAKDEVMDKVAGLDSGADDYLTKPFLTQELLLRIQRILQRCYRGELWRTAAKTLQLGQRTVYLADALVRLPDGTAQPLTATERALLQKLAENRGHIVTYDAVCEAVGGRLLRVREQPECSHPPPAGKAGTQPQQAAVPFNGAGHRL